MILVRHSPSGTYFLVRASEELAALETLGRSYPGALLEILEKSGDLALVRVLRPGATAEDPDDPPPSLRSISFPSRSPHESPEGAGGGGGPEPGQG